jgi:hypothetical protein
MNEQAWAELGCREKQIVIIPGATHLFEEPGALATVARLAAEWFSNRFTGADHAQTDCESSQTFRQSE